MSNLQANLRLRLAQLNTTWEELARAAKETPANIRAVVRRGTPQGRTLQRLAQLVGVPSHNLLAPDFDPRLWPVPQALADYRKECDEEEICDELHDGHGKEV